MHLGYSGERKQTVQSSEEVNSSLVGTIVLTEVTKERHRKSCESQNKGPSYQQGYQFGSLADCELT